MKTLFVGLGSIGQRHLSNFRMIVGNDCEVLACRSTNHNTVIENGVARECESLEQYYNLNTFNHLDDALGQSPEVVFITNPSSKHISVAMKAVEHGCDVFIEKPLSNSLDQIDLLRKSAKDKQSLIMIGYQTRFHPCYKLVRSILSEGLYGNVISAGFEWGTYLPSHHPYEDYRKSYAARQDLGGGVVFGLIHEIDMICSFWGKPEEVSAIGGKFSSLEMDAEDTVSVLMSFKQDEQRFPVSLFLSYAQTKEIRRFRIQLDKATVVCDLQRNNVTLYDEEGAESVCESYCGLKRNQLFLDEMEEFLASVHERRQPMIQLKDGIESLKLALRIKEQMID